MQKSDSEAIQRLENTRCSGERKEEAKLSWQRPAGHARYLYNLSAMKSFAPG